MHKGKLVLFSPGLGYINRGIETFTQQLYEVILQHQDLEVELFQGLGETIPGAKSVWAPKRNAKLYNFPLFSSFKHRSYWIENVIFSLPIVFHCYTQACNIIHFNEGIPANVLYHLRNRIGGSFKLLFCNGGPLLPQQYQRYDYAQLLNPVQLNEALEAGLPKERLFMIPYGINSQFFSPSLSPQDIQAWRRSWKLPLNRTIILSAGAINTSHKRMDWLVKEFSGLNPDQFFLWMIGQQEAETSEVVTLAESCLRPGSYRFDRIPYAQMPYAYKVSDYFVLCSLMEGLGLVYLEAMSAGLPVIAHRSDLTEWILGNENLGLVDMTKPAHVKDKIIEFTNHTEACLQQAEQNQKSVFSRYDWQALYGQYLEMYQQIYG